MHDHLVATLDPDQLEALVDRFYATYTPYLPLLHDIQRCIDEGKRPKLQPQELPLFCPILEDGACLAYPVRPAICRGYGHFQLTNPEGDDQAIFACRDQETVLKKQLGDGAGPRAELPSFNPFYQAIATLCDGEEKLLIPLWFERAFPRPE